MTILSREEIDALRNQAQGSSRYAEFDSLDVEALCDTYDALRDAVLAWIDEPDWPDDPAVASASLARLREVVARVERGDS